MLSERDAWRAILAGWQRGQLGIDDLRALCQDFDVDAALLDFLGSPGVQAQAQAASPDGRGY